MTMVEYNPQELGPPEGMISGSRAKHTLEILLESAKRDDPNINLKKYVQDLVTAVKGQKIFLLRMGNTVFVMRPLGGTNVEGHIATLDDLSTVQRSIGVLFKTLKGMGFTHATGTSPSAAFVRMAKQLGASYAPVQSPHGPMYQFDMDL
jgi:deoxyxylulose-5-phosphate synthase